MAERWFQNGGRQSYYPVLRWWKGLWLDYRRTPEWDHPWAVVACKINKKHQINDQLESFAVCSARPVFLVSPLGSAKIWDVHALLWLFSTSLQYTILYYSIL